MIKEYPPQESMKHLKENLLVQFSLASFLIIGILAITLSAVIVTQLDHTVEHLGDHGDAMMAGAMIKETDHFSIPSLSAEVRTLQFRTLGIVGVSFFVLYTGLVLIVWRGWATIVRQRHHLQTTVNDLEQSSVKLDKEMKERQHLQEQLQQSNKMEGIGRLAGGVAHDFNNLLTAISGYSQLSLREAPPESPISNHLLEIQRATKRATKLTGQLLAFSRHQVIEPKVIDLNDLVINLDKMLRRLIGEDIELVTLLAARLEPVKADSGQIEQVLMNLAVNAQDAMPKGGKLFIETANVSLDADYVRQHNAVSPGRHVMLIVSDTGMGMSKEVQDHIFEPFFTTKEVGKGTGLGLATCFGIVQQSGGHIEVNSEPGQGTSFRIFLPVIEEACEAQPQIVDSFSSPQGEETVLIAEDEPLVRSMAALVLRDQGYEVLEAANGDEALRTVEKHGGEGIELLLTDVVMPQMGGPELAKKLHATHPDIKVLFTSGYTGDYLSNTLTAGTEFLAKPYLPDTLAVKVREVLDSV